MTSLRRLADDLSSGGAETRPSHADPGLVITSYRGRALDPPVRLLLSQRELDAHLEGMAADGRKVFPRVDPRTGAYRLLLVHLDETLDTKVGPGSVIRLVDGHLRSSPEYPLEPLLLQRHVDGGADLAWVAEASDDRQPESWP